MSNNIFQIWDSIGRKVPFAVRQDSWSTEGYYKVVIEVRCPHFPSTYGYAFGYSTINGKISNFHENDIMKSTKWPSEHPVIRYASHHKWSLVENADLTSFKEGLTATKQTTKL